MTESQPASNQTARQLGHALAPQLLSFGVVGTIGFAVDAVLLTVFSTACGLDLLPSRMISFTCATLVTWLLNRSITFACCREKDGASLGKKEYILYMPIQAAGAALNFLIFLALIEWQPMLRQFPVIPLAGGAAIAMLFNFLMSRKFVFGIRCL